MSEYIYASNGEPLANSCGEIALARHEIVRCRDCVNASFDEFGGGWCCENCREIKLWDYCAWAKRREK